MQTWVLKAYRAIFGEAANDQNNFLQRFQIAFDPSRFLSASCDRRGNLENPFVRSTKRNFRSANEQGKEVKMGSAKKWKTKSKKTTQGDRVVSSKRKAKGTKKLITIGELIKYTRKKQNKQAIDVAKECNVTAECVFQWERRDYIIAKRLPQLSNALGISLRRLKAANENGKGNGRAAARL